MTGEDSRFSSYSPRRLGDSGGGYSSFVRVLKIAMPLVALVIIGVLIARLTENPQQKLTALPDQEKTTPGQIELVGAKYEGTDDQGRPYAVSADKASRAMDAPDTIIFEKPLADITLQDKTWVAVKAGSGAFDRVTETLILRDNVTVFHDSGYELALRDLTINLKNKMAATPLPVSGHGPLGTIDAQNMTVSDEGNLIVFGGPAKMTFFRLAPTRKARG